MITRKEHLDAMSANHGMLSASADAIVTDVAVAARESEAA